MNSSNAYWVAGLALLADTGCEVKWRKSNSGVAHTSSDAWAVEAPEPRGPVSFGIFAHEIAHQVLHRQGSKPRWQEEIEAEEWALAQFDRHNLPGRERYEQKAVAHLAYAFGKALRRARTPELRVALASRILDAYPEWWSRAEAAHTNESAQLISARYDTYSEAC